MIEPGLGACTSALHQKMKLGMEPEEWERVGQKLRPAQDADKYFVSKWVPVTFPAIPEANLDTTVINVVWAVKGPIEVELCPENIDYVIKAISMSPAQKKGSPKRKRRLKRRLSDADREGTHEEGVQEPGDDE